MPAAHKALDESPRALEQHFKDMQDSRVHGRRQPPLHSANAQRKTHRSRLRVRIAVDMVAEKLISTKRRGPPHPGRSRSLICSHRSLIAQSREQAKKIGSGLAGGPGAASGHVVFSAEEAVARSAKGQKVVLARIGNLAGRLARNDRGEGILTSARRRLSHAALVARQMGKVCVRGASWNPDRLSKAHAQCQRRRPLAQGDYISIDGTAGEAFAGEVTTAPSEIVQALVDRSLDASASLTYAVRIRKADDLADEFRNSAARTNMQHLPEQKLAWRNAVAFLGAERKSDSASSIEHYVLSRKAHQGGPRRDARDDFGRHQRRAIAGSG